MLAIIITKRTVGFKSLVHAVSEHTIFNPFKKPPVANGINNKNDNSNALLPEKPSHRAATKVLPKRDMPGKRADACTRPSTTAMRQLNDWVDFNEQKCNEKSSTAVTKKPNETGNQETEI